MREQIGRQHPAEGVYIFLGQPTIVFLTVCSWKRRLQLANNDVHQALIESWREADKWSVGFYMIIPDHIHLFCAPKDEHYTIERWITFWKRRVRHRLKTEEPVFQAHGFHHRLRRDENYSEKWEYVRLNPVRVGLVADADQWPYQGMLNELRW